jgi:hypothetical protein
MTKDKSAMTKIDLMFGFILLWSIVSTSLLVMQHYHHSDNDGSNSLSATLSKKGLPQDDFNYSRHRPLGQRRGNRAQDKKKLRKHKLDLSAARKRSKTAKVQLLPEEQYYNNVEAEASVNEFPFTRSLISFDSSDTFYLYIVQSTLDESSPSLEWSEVPWKQLVHNWTPTTTFSDLTHLSTPLHQDGPSSTRGSLPKKLVIHCLPKTASTTLRNACKRLIINNCPTFEKEQKSMADPIGYRDPTRFYDIVNTCKEIDQFCVQGGDLEMNVIGYSGDKESEVQTENMQPTHFVHLVPFRNFNQWAESALKQIYVIDGKCDRINTMLEEGCLGYRELYMELYTKSVLAGLIGMSLNMDTSDNNAWRKNQHHIVLYNYEDTNTIVTEMSNFLGIEPMQRTKQDLKGVRSEGTCPAATLQKFHECHDETLSGMDAIVDLETELKRRKAGFRAMKKIEGDYRKKEGRTRSKIERERQKGHRWNEEEGSDER